MRLELRTYIEPPAEGFVPFPTLDEYRDVWKNRNGSSNAITMILRKLWALGQQVDKMNGT